VKGSQTIEFVLRRKVGGVELTPTTIGFSLFNQFNREVEQLVGGSDRNVGLDEVTLKIVDGSYKLFLTLPLAVMLAFGPDLRRLGHEDSLGEVDPKRAEVIKTWQARAKTSDGGEYEIKPSAKGSPRVAITKTTDFRDGSATQWVQVEKYLFGKVVDMGGVQKANVHLVLEDTGQTVIAAATQDFLEEQKVNHLYHKTLLRVQALENVRTGALRSVRLINFADYNPQYDEAGLERFINAGTKAWAGVPNAAKWVRKLRGGG
jgi:hypothetical protein